MRGVIVFLLCITISVCSFGQFEGYSVERIVTKAYEHIEKEDFQSAIKAFEKIHRSDEYYTIAQIEIIDILVSQKKFDEAKHIFESLKDGGYFDRMPELYINYGSFYSGQKMYEESLAIYSEAEEKYPRYHDVLFNKALIYYNMDSIQQSINYTKKAVDLNPGYATAHYFLGELAFESGQLSEGVLAMLGFLAYNPNHEYAQSAIITLNKKMAENFLDEKDFVFSESGDKFDQLDLILRKQLPLNDKYKLNCKIDEVYTRHTQATLEYVSTHEIGDGFFEQLYVPILADIHKNGHTENFIYYTLGGLESVAEKVKKQSKKVAKFYDGYFVPNFWNLFAYRTREVAGEERQVVVYSEASIPTMSSEIKNNKQNGHGEFYDKYGRITGTVTFVDNNPDGLVTYFDSEGNKSEEVHYENGIKNGKQIIYFNTGEKYSEWSNVNDLMDGDYITYYKDGSIYCKSKMQNGEYDQTSFCNYSSGQKSFELTYVNGMVNGVRTNYWRNGDLKSEENLKQNLYEGPSKYYSYNGELQQELIYTQNEVSNNYTIKDNLGNVNFEYVIDGDETITKEYKGGILSQVIAFKKDEIEYVESYMNGVKYVKQTYKDNKVKDIIQYSKNDIKGKKIKVDSHKLYDVEGNLVNERNYNDGVLDGQSNYYYLNSNKSSQLNFINGMETGISKFYDIKGRLKTEYEIRNDTLNGYYVNYKDGILTSRYSYKKGKLNGPGYTYHKNGTISMDGFYKDDSPVGDFMYYNNDGILYQIDIYVDGENVMSKYYDKQGDEIFEVDYENTEGNVVKKLTTNSEIMTFELKNKEFNGAYTAVDVSGDSIYNFTYLSGYREGRSLYYNGNNEICFDGNYRENLQHGLCKYYDDLNTLRVTSMFFEDEENGEEIRYAKNGGVISSWTNIDDMIIGEKYIYNSKGALLLTLYYSEGVPTRYKTMNDQKWKNLELGEKEVVVKYENGNLALQIGFHNRLLDGKYIIHLEDGNPIFEANYVKGMFHGNSIYYYDDGSPYKRMNFENDISQGDVIYFDENGEMRLKYTYKDDLIHGDYEIYEKGQLVKTKTYYYNEVIEVK